MSPKVPKKTLSDLKAVAQKGLSTIDVDTIKDKATEATSTLVEKAGELKDAAVAAKDDIADKLTELDRMLQESVTEYNDAYTIMNDKGVQLYIERCRSLDSISFVESLVNSIANRPKSFDAEFEDKIKSFKRTEEVFSNTSFRGILYQDKEGRILARPLDEEVRSATDEEAMLYQAMLDLHIAS